MLKIKPEPSHWRPKKYKYDGPTMSYFFKHLSNRNIYHATKYDFCLPEKELGHIVLRPRRNTI